MEAKEVEARIKGELGNFALDAIEYYKKTGLNHPPNLPAYPERIMEISFKAGEVNERARIMGIIEEYGLDKCSVRDDVMERQSKGWQAYLIVKEFHKLMAFFVPIYSLLLPTHTLSSQH